MRTFALAVCALLALTSAGLAGDGPLESAMEAFSEGRYERVLEICSGVDADGADRPKADYLAGEAALLLDRPADAEKSFRAVLAKRPEAVPARVGLGRALLAAGKAAEAVKVLEEAVEAEKRNPAALRALGRAQTAAGDPARGLKTLAKAWKRDRKDPLTCRAYVSALLERGETKTASAVAKGLVKARKDHPMGWFLTGMVLDRDGEYDEAIAAYEKALEKDEKFLDAHKNIAIICHAVNPTYRDVPRTKKAFRHYRAYFDLGGKDEELRKIYLRTKGFLERMGMLDD